MSNQPGSANGDIQERRVGDISVVAVSGTVDMITAPKLEAAIGSAATSEPSAIVVDFTAVEFLASAGMGVLVATHGDLAPAVKLVVGADGPATSRPLKLVGSADVVDLYGTLDEALAALQS